MNKSKRYDYDRLHHYRILEKKAQDNLGQVVRELQALGLSRHTLERHDKWISAWARYWKTFQTRDRFEQDRPF